MIRNSSGIPPYNENSVLKLIIVSGSCFAAYWFIYYVMMIYEADPAIFPALFTSNIAMPPVAGFASKAWTILTYGWMHEDFWVLFSNMIWLYAFGSLVQMLVGHRQLFPIFIYSMIAGGIFYQVAQLFPGGYFDGRAFMTGAQAGVVGLAVAALTLSPDYKFHFSETFRIPLVLVFVIFIALQLMNANINHEGAPLFLLAGGALSGYLYVLLLRNGYRPGGWAYDFFDKVNAKFEPNEKAYASKRTNQRKTISMYSPKPMQGITQNKIDAILDKINQDGYEALSKEDKETLLKAAGNDKN